MRKIKIKTWKSNVAKRDENNKIVGTELIDENLLIAINVLIGNKKPEEMPKGLDLFRTMNRISKAFEKAEKTKLLVLEEADYKFIKETIEKDIPSAWGMSPNLSDAVELFLEAKSEEKK